MDASENRTLAFCLFKYFPHGGLQRDMLRIALACRQRGYAISVYTTAWEGTVPEGFEIHRYEPTAWANHRRMRQYQIWLAGQLAGHAFASVVGFNKLPGLDIYYAADGCFKTKARDQHRWLHILGPRYRLYRAFEKAVFGRQSRTHILMLSKIQEALYVKYYATPAHRIHSLPPNLTRDRIAGPDAPQTRAAFRQELGLTDGDQVLLQLGSGFRTKGLDRSIRALAALPQTLRARTQLLVVGDDASRRYVRLAEKLKISERVRFLGARDDVPRILLGTDLLVHPAYHENTGTVLLEALASGLPVIASGVCGYAHYIEQAQAGWVLPAPFDPRRFQDTLRAALERPDLRDVGRRGIAFAQRENLYGMVETAVAIIDKLARENAV